MQVQQHSLASGSLIMWTKGFTTPGVVGEDVVALLARACSKLGLRVKVNALVNDTVGTLMSHAVTDTNTRIGMIVGTGSNAAYVEKRAKVTKMGPPKPDEHELMVINLECGNFGSNTDYLPLTEYDRKTIGESTAPDEQWLEKMISGMYLGEIARQAILDLYGKGLVFGGEKLPAQLENRHGLDTEVMSRALAIPADQATAFLQKELGADISDADAAVLLPLFDVVGERSARLCGASVAALVEHMSEACTAAVDGSVFEHYRG